MTRKVGIWIELDETSPLIRGVVHGSKGVEIGFEGWIEFMSALSALGATP